MNIHKSHTPSIEIVTGAPTEPDAFLKWAVHPDRGEEAKFELSRGQVIKMMIQVTRDHARICTNLIVELRGKLDPDKYGITTADFGVRTPFGVRYPDILVEPYSKEGKELAADTPVFIAEVLSRSTMGVDFVEKREEYLAIDSLQTYLICAQDEPRAWVWHRADGEWSVSAEMLEGKDGNIQLAALGIELKMRAVFRNIPSPETD